MDDWGWEHLRPWLELRRELPRRCLSFASSTAPEPEVLGSAPQRGPGFASLAPRPECGVALPRISYAMRMRSRWRGKVFLST